MLSKEPELWSDDGWIETTFLSEVAMMASWSFADAGRSAK
jgi:hypothetical protein